MLTESCVKFFCRPEPFKALFCEVIYRPVERVREKGEQGKQQSSRRPRPCRMRVHSNLPISASSRQFDRWAFELPTVETRSLVDSNGLAFFKFLWSKILHRPCWESYFWDFRIAFLGKYWKDEALIRHRDEEISSRWDAGVFDVRILIVCRHL